MQPEKCPSQDESWIRCAETGLKLDDRPATEISLTKYNNQNNEQQPTKINNLNNDPHCHKPSQIPTIYHQKF